MTSSKDDKLECGACFFWVDIHDEWAGKGQCRRFPPTATLHDNRGDHSWPQTTRQKWCGEFRASEGDNNGSHE